MCPLGFITWIVCRRYLGLISALLDHMSFIHRLYAMLAGSGPLPRLRKTQTTSPLSRIHRAQTFCGSAALTPVYRCAIPICRTLFLAAAAPLIDITRFCTSKLAVRIPCVRYFEVALTFIFTLAAGQHPSWSRTWPGLRAA